MSELKPCPFCGGEAEVERYTLKPYAACTKCGCSMPDRHQTAEQAIEVWNTRTPEQAVAATLDKPNRIYILRGTDPGAMPSCGGETNELLGVFATREAAEEAMSANGCMYCDLNVTEWEVDE